MSEDRQLYAEDLHEGFSFVGSEKALTVDLFKGFAELTGDRHPIHYDAAYAGKTRFGRPVAHGLLLMAMTAVGATELSARLEAAMVALVSQRSEFLKPAFVGDRLRTSYEVLSNAVTKSGTTARVELMVRVANAQGDTLLEGRHVYLLRCRPA
ncbi:MAG: MaoC family dehydratase N-terminal domain-containing protein [Xanthobacteraceae bacterium]|nr:MaoC family dehydratase N-terminal domain-containing protein [Xanthobacteraceae bacterium]